MQEQQPPINEASPMAAVSGEPGPFLEEQLSPPYPRDELAQRNAGDLVGAVALLLIPLAFLEFIALSLSLAVANFDLLLLLGGFWLLLWLIGTGLLVWAWWRGRQRLWEVALGWMVTVTWICLLPLLLLLWPRFRRWLAGAFAPWRDGSAATPPESRRLAAARIAVFAVVPLIVVWAPMVVSAVAFEVGEAQTATTENCENLAAMQVEVDRVDLESMSLTLPAGAWYVVGCDSSSSMARIDVRHANARWDTRVLQVTYGNIAGRSGAKDYTYEEFLEELRASAAEPDEGSRRFRNHQASAEAVTLMGRDCVLRTTTHEDHMVPDRPGEVLPWTNASITCLAPREDFPGDIFVLWLSARTDPVDDTVSVDEIEDVLFAIADTIEFSPQE